MSASTERKIIRWFHILASIPIIGYIYGPVSEIPEASIAVRWGILPAVVVSGFWLWLGAKVKRWGKGGSKGDAKHRDETNIEQGTPSRRVRMKQISKGL